jgi:hypothetical protein
MSYDIGTDLGYLFISEELIKHNLRRCHVLLKVQKYMLGSGERRTMNAKRKGRPTPVFLVLCDER